MDTMKFPILMKDFLFHGDLSYVERLHFRPKKWEPKESGERTNKVQI